MFGALGRTPLNNFYMGTQNGLKLENLCAGFLILAFNVEIMQHLYLSYVCIGSHSFAMFAAHA